MLTFNYDKTYDVLYILFSDDDNTYGDEDECGIVLHRNFSTNDITGVTIFDFEKKYRANQLPALNFPVELDYSEMTAVLL